MSASLQKNSSRSFIAEFQHTAFTLIFILLGSIEVLAQRPLGIEVSS